MSLSDAQAELDVITTRLQKEHPATNDGRALRAVALGRAVVDLGVGPTRLASGWLSAPSAPTFCG